jgi:hypothetical protein
MKLNEALQFISRLGYVIKGTKKIKWFSKNYLIHANHAGKSYWFLLDKGKLHKEVPLKSGNSFWAELEEI